MNIKYFWHENCSPCRENKQIITQLQQNPNVDIEVINVLEEPEKANKYKIRTVPTLLITEKNTNSFMFNPKQIKDYLQKIANIK